MAEQTLFTIKMTRKRLIQIVIISGLVLVFIISSMSMVGHRAVYVRPTSVEKDVSQTRLFSHNLAKTRYRSNVTIIDQNFTSILFVNNTYIYNSTYLAKNGGYRNHSRHNQPHNSPRHVRRILRQTWEESRANYENLRMQINAAVNSHDYFIVTQQNVVLNQKLQLALQEKVLKVVTEEIFKRLPEVSPLPKKAFSRCVVMGSSGILTGSKCGKAIDSADFVFRCNMPPVEEFVEDVGSKSNLTTMNIMSIVENRYNLLSSFVEERRLLRDLSQYSGYLWLPLFGLQSTYSFSWRVFKFLDALDQEILQPVVGYPDHFRKMGAFWEQRGLRMRPSTGLYLTTTAISLCDHVDLYGFWPFDEDPRGNSVQYHYYDKLLAPTRVHNLDFEFDKLLKLHEKGIIHIHEEPCEYDT